MDIRFCEITKESIPDGEFEAGRAITVGGKSYYVSAAMQRLMSRGRMRSWLTFLLVLYAAGITTFLLIAEMRREKPNPNAVSDAVVAEMQSRDTKLEAHLTDLYNAKLDGISKDIKTSFESAETHRGKLHDSAALLAKRTDDQTKDAKGRFEGMDRRLERVEDEIVDLRRWLIKVQGTGEEILRRQNEIEANRPGPGEVPAATPTKPDADPKGPVTNKPDEPDPEHERELKMWIERLKSKNNDLVFTATVKLADLKDLRATQPLLTVLDKHKDFYARLGAATALGTLTAVDAVTPLIDALADKDELVRTAANEALIAITGQDLGFDADMSRNERQKTQRKFRTWFKQNELDLRKRLDQPVGGTTRPRK